MICAATEEECPITSLVLGLTTIPTEDPDDIEVEKITATHSYTPDKLPLSSFKFSSSTPCISYTQEPASNAGQLTDEYTYSEEGCIDDPFFSTAIDTRYTPVEGFTVK